MAERKLNESELMPCLIERLTDLEPEKQSETPGSRNFNLRQYRESVLRDLEWLLNSRSFLSHEEMNEETPPAVLDSVLNYGVCEFSGRALSDERRQRMTQRIREAIERFEPRIDPASLEIEILGRANDPRLPPTTVVLNLRGVLMALPVPEELVIRTELDTETGTITVR